MPVDATSNQLTASYRHLRDQARHLFECSGNKDAPPAAACLLLFYAAECGLKAAILRHEGKRSTADLSAAQGGASLYSHNLDTLQRDLVLRLSGAEAPVRLRRCARAASGRGGKAIPQAGPVDYHQLHEAWRYGVTLDRADQEVAIAALNQLLDICKRRLGA